MGRNVAAYSKTDVLVYACLGRSIQLVNSGFFVEGMEGSHCEIIVRNHNGYYAYPILKFGQDTVDASQRSVYRVKLSDASHLSLTNHEKIIARVFLTGQYESAFVASGEYVEDLVLALALDLPTSRVVMLMKTKRWLLPANAVRAAPVCPLPDPVPTASHWLSAAGDRDLAPQGAGFVVEAHAGRFQGLVNEDAIMLRMLAQVLSQYGHPNELSGMPHHDSHCHVCGAMFRYPMRRSTHCFGCGHGCCAGLPCSTSAKTSMLQRLRDPSIISCKDCQDTVPDGIPRVTLTPLFHIEDLSSFGTGVPSPP